MFAELIEWLTTPRPAAARRLGYLREAVAIRARYRRHRENWRPHLDATRAFAQRAAAIPPRKRIPWYSVQGPFLTSRSMPWPPATSRSN